MTFRDKLQFKWNENKFLCVGLDQGSFEFDKNIIEQTYDLVCAYKPNAAFYKEAELQETVSYLKNNHPDIPIILDAKRGDIGNTNKAYVKTIFDDLKADAVTVHPYLGKESLEPFLERTEKCIFVLVKTSNSGAGEFQDLVVNDKPVYQIVAEHVKNWGNNLGVIVGATYPEELKKIRNIVGDMPILIPGIGTQGGDLETVFKIGLNRQNQGIIIAVSRSIIFDPNPKEAALKLHQEIVNFLK